MKKLISVLLSITLAVLCFSSLVLSADTAETAQDGRSYVIWDADPTKVSTENGANAKPNVESWEEALRPSGTAVVDYSENVPSFKLTTGFYYNKGVSFRSGTTMFGQNNTPIAFTGWMNHRDVFKAIAPYVSISYDVYVEDEQNRNAHIKMTAMPNDAEAHVKDAFQEFGTLDDFNGIPANQWVSRTAKIGSINDGNKNWSQGFIVVSLEWFSGCDDEANMTFKIRNLKLTVNENDRDKINAALATIDGIDTKNWFTGTYNGSETDWRFPTTSDGLDYFAGLAAFDKGSAYSTNRNNVTVSGSENGTVSDNQTGIYAGETVTVTATPNEGYEAAVSAKDGNGDVVALTDNGDGTYSFIMPASPVNVTVSFFENISYVIWDADPTKVSTENGANAKPNVESWEEALRPSGTAVVDYSENVPSFKLTTGFYYNKGVSFRSGTTMFGQNNTPIAFTGWMNHRDVFKAIAPYVSISYDVYVEDEQNRNAHIKMTAMPNDAEAHVKDAFQEFGTLDDFNGIPANQWVSRTAKIGSINDGNKNWSQGFIVVSLEWFSGCDDEANMTFKIRNLKLTVNEKDRDAINAALATIDGIDTKNWFTGNYNGSETDWRFPTTSDGLDYFAGLTAFDESSFYSVNRETGDLNSDGSTDIVDLVRFKKYAADSTVGVNYAARDCDGNNLYSSASDLAALRKILLGWTL
ncbi:MAG: hypothetical protein ACI4FN_00240 [Acutalibacteraceae bacterium]